MPNHVSTHSEFAVSSLIPFIKKLFHRPKAIASAPQDANIPPIIPKVSVVIPALNEAKRIAEVVQYCLADPVTSEVIVIDDSSIDDTASLAQQAGARVITSTMLGKGASMQDGMLAAQHEIVVYLDGDLTGLSPHIISQLVEPIVEDEADFVKACFGRSGGRVTELTAKPMLKIFFDELAHFTQPLGGIIAVKKSLLQQMHFEDGYGVDIGLLIDAYLKGARLAQVDIGSLEHDSQPLDSLGRMAQEVSRVIFERAKSVGRLSVDQVMSVFELERQNQTDIEMVLAKLKGCKKLVLLDMDGTVITSRFVVELAKATGRYEQLMALLDTSNVDAATRSEKIAALFRFVHKSQIEEVAKTLPIREGVIQTVNRLRRKGYKVGLVSDSYFIGVEIVRRRIFADFSLAHTLPFDGNVCKGEINTNRAFSRDVGCSEHELCKSNVLRYITEQEPSLTQEGVVVVGDNLNDLCLLKLAHHAYIIEPKHESLRQQGFVELQSFGQLLDELQVKQSVVTDTEHGVS